MSRRTIDNYLALPYAIELYDDDSDGYEGYVARVTEVLGCITQADTMTGLEEMIQDAMRAWIESALEDGEPILEPKQRDD